MSTAVQYASLVCVVAGLAAAVVGLLATRDPRLAARLTLDLWLAAALLRLALPPAAPDLLGAAVLIGVRQLIGLWLRRPAGPGVDARETGSPRV